MDNHILFLVSVGQLVLRVHYFAHKGLVGGAHLRLFMRSRASPAAHRIRTRTLRASACAHRRRRTRTRTREHRRRRTRTLIAFGSCARVRRTRTLIAGGSCAHVRRPLSAGHTHACIHVGGRGRSRIPCQACQPSVQPKPSTWSLPNGSSARGPARGPCRRSTSPKVTEVSSCGFAESVNMKR